MENKKWIDVSSSQIVKISYDEKAETLYIEFKRNLVYSYHGVTLQEFLNFKASESKGKFFYKNIKSVKPYKKLS